MQPGALTVVKKEGDVFKLDEKLLESVLKRPDVANKKVSMISIAGVYREGKSFLMNFLLRYLDHLSRSSEGDWMEGGNSGLTGFNWKGGPDSITEGILLWSEPFILRDMEDEEVAVFLMDTQGIYDPNSTVKDCTTIFALSTLLSSVTVGRFLSLGRVRDHTVMPAVLKIYNITKLINEIHLQQMQMFTKYAQQAIEKYDTEKPFQRLMFLIRDWPSPCKHAFGLEGGRNYLDDKLKVKLKGSRTDLRKKLGSRFKIASNQKPELQKVRKYIRSSFEKVECFLMPHPGQGVAEWDSEKDLKLADIRDEFKEQLRVLMPHLLTEITPMHVNGESITCAELFEYFKAYSAMFEGDELPEPKSVVKANAMVDNERAEKKARAQYKAEMQKLCGDGRPYVENLRAKHDGLKGEAIALFESIKKAGGSEFSDKYRALLEKDIEEAYKEFEKSNNQQEDSRMTPEDGSEEKRAWPKRTPDQRQLFASVDKWLAFLPYLSKPELDKCREVCEWTNQLIEKHSGGKLKQRRQLYELALDILPFKVSSVLTPLDIDKWMEDEKEMEKIEAKAKQLIGETIYPYEPEDATVRISIEPQLGQHLRIYVKNRLDEKDALLFARLMPRITPPTAAFLHMDLVFDHTPELPADAPYEGSYFNLALFSLSSNADGSGGGPTKLITHYLTIFGPMEEDSPRGMIKTAQLTVQCQELHLPSYYFPDDLPATCFLPLVAVARPLNAPASIEAYWMEDGQLDEILNFFTHTVPGFESAAPYLRVTIHDPTAWPETLPKESAINPREEQLAERLYKFRRYNHETGERLEIEVRGSFHYDEDEVKGEDCLRVAEMVLLFRPDSDDK